MKSIVLMGASRAGKSTFAKMLRNTLPQSQIISGDMVRLAYRDEIYKNKAVKSSLMKDIPEYTNLLKSYFHYTIKYNPNDTIILDTVDFTPSDYKIFKNSLIIVFGYPNLTKTQCLSNWWRCDVSNDWAKYKTDEQLLEKATKEIEKSKKYMSEAKQYNLKFVNTSFDREKKLNDLLEWVKENI